MRSTWTSLSRPIAIDAVRQSPIRNARTESAETDFVNGLLINQLADGGHGPVTEEATLRALAFSEYLEAHARGAYRMRDTLNRLPKNAERPSHAVGGTQH
jgi:hypothetical protein